jgi:hypothetical protein
MNLTRISIFLIAVSPFVWSCESPSSIGEDFVQNEIVDIVFTDTTTINMSTILFDSISTTNTGRYLIGYHEDDQMGKIESQAYFKLGLDSISTFPDDDATYLYTELVLFYDDYSYYDTLQSISIMLYQLDEVLEPIEDDLFYNTDEFEYSSDPLVSNSFTPRPNQREEQTFTLNDQEFGRAIFEAAKEPLEFAEDYEDLLKGFVLKTDGLNSGAFIGFSAGSYIVIHFREDGEDRELKLAGPTESHFNSISTDRSGTYISELEGGTTTTLSTFESNNVGYLQGGSGVGLKIDLPGVRNMLEVIDPGYIIDAKLYLTPIKGSYEDETPLITNLAIYQVDKLNRIIIDTELDYTLQIDKEFEEDTNYVVDLLPYIQLKLLSETENTDGLLFLPAATEMGRSVDRMYIGDQINGYRASVKIFLLDYIVN